MLKNMDEACHQGPLVVNGGHLVRANRRPRSPENHAGVVLFKMYPNEEPLSMLLPEQVISTLLPSMNL